MTTGKNRLNDITLNFFYRDNSMDCQITRRALYSILDNYLGKIRIQEINFDHNKEICDAYNVYGVPTLLIIKNNKVLNRYSGILDASEINVLLKPVIKSIQY
jgi:thioredoxin 1